MKETLQEPLKATSSDRPRVGGPTCARTPAATITFWGLGVKNRVSVRLPSCFGGLGLRVESLAVRAEGFCQK